MTYQQIVKGTGLFSALIHLEGKHPIRHESSWTDGDGGLLIEWIKVEPLGIVLFAALMRWEFDSWLMGVNCAERTSINHAQPVSFKINSMSQDCGGSLNNGVKCWVAFYEVVRWHTFLDCLVERKGWLSFYAAIHMFTATAYLENQKFVPLSLKFEPIDPFSPITSFYNNKGG